MQPKLVAVDLDGTLLTDSKVLTSANKAALQDMAGNGCVVVLASGRLGSSMLPYAQALAVDCAMLTLNGAVVYKGHARDSEIIHSSPLQSKDGKEQINLVQTAQYRLFQCQYPPVRVWHQPA